MITLKRKLYVAPDYYHGLSDAEAEALKKMRQKLAKKYYGDRKKYIKGADISKKNSYYKLMIQEKEELAKAEKLIRDKSRWSEIDAQLKKDKERIKNIDRSFETRARRFKEAVNDNYAKNKELEAQKIVERLRRDRDRDSYAKLFDQIDLREKRKQVAADLRKKKNLRQGLAIGGGLAAATTAGIVINNAAKKYKERKNKDRVKDAILGKDRDEKE